MSDDPYPELKNEFFEALDYYDGGGLDLKKLQTIMSSMEDIIKEIQGCVTFWFCERELGKRVMNSMSVLLRSIRVHESERPAFYYESQDNLIPLGGQRYLFSSFLSIISSSQNSEIQPGSFLPDDWCMEAKDAIYEFMRVKKVEKKPKSQPEEEDDDDDEDEENLDEEEDDSDDDLIEDMMLEDGDEEEQSEEELLTVVGLIWNFGINHDMGLKLGTFGLPMDLMRLLKFVRTKKDVDSSIDDFLGTDVGSKLVTALMVLLRIPEVAVVCKRADDCVAIIKSLIGGDCAASKYSVSLIWAFLFGRDEGQDESLPLLESNPEILEGIIEIAAYELQGDPAPGCDQAGEYDFMVLIRGLCAMSVSDANKSVMKDKISSLLPILYKLLHLFNTNAPHVEPNEEYDGSPGGGGSDHDTMEAVVELLLQLSFLYDEDDELREVYGPSGGGDLEVLGLMQALLAVEDRKVADDTKKNASNLVSRLTVKDKTAAAARKASLVPEAADSATGATNTKHVMLSYSWAANKPMVVALAKELRKLGVDVWRDEDGSRLVSSMQGATDEKMAEAIDSSSTVIVIVSPEYKESANCRMEGRYVRFFLSSLHSLFLFFIARHDMSLTIIYPSSSLPQSMNQSRPTIFRSSACSKSTTV
jgi:hypothetical protein